MVQLRLRDVEVADSIVLLSADWPSDFAAECAECHHILNQPRTTSYPDSGVASKTNWRVDRLEVVQILILQLRCSLMSRVKWVMGLFHVCERGL